MKQTDAWGVQGACRERQGDLFLCDEMLVSGHFKLARGVKVISACPGHWSDGVTWLV